MPALTEDAQKLAAIRMWADANATMTHVAEFPAVPGERQQKELAEEQEFTVGSLRKALGFQATQFMDSDEGWRFTERLNRAINRAYKLGLEDGKDAHYRALGKNQDSFMSAFLGGLAREAKALTDEIKSATTEDEDNAE